MTPGETWISTGTGVRHLRVGGAEMNLVLVKIVLAYALMLEQAEAFDLPLEHAVELQEDLALYFREFSPSERSEFVDRLKEIAPGWSPREQEIIKRLPEEMGMI
jgi:hypothetical protein